MSHRHEPSPSPEGANGTEGGLWDVEPLATVKDRPRRFAWGLPVVILLPMAVAFPMAEGGMAQAVALQLFLQTAGLLWLYVPAVRGRYREAAARLPKAPPGPGLREGEPGAEGPGSRG